MKIGALLKTTGGKVAAAGGTTVVAIGIAAAVLLQGEGFRSISVQEVAGTVNIVGEKNNGQAYVGEHLYSGDDVTVGEASELIMCMDDDKYVYADANTHFSLEASAAKEDSRIKIYLDAGSELNELQSKLNPNETYEVDTPNSTMSVRGTKFRVTVYTATDNMTYTLIEISEGEVLVRLKTKDGKYNGVERIFVPGQSALVRGNYDFSEFVGGDRIDDVNLEKDSDEEEVLMLAYKTLPKDGMARLIEILEKSEFIDSEEEGSDDSGEEVSGDGTGTVQTGDGTVELTEVTDDEGYNESDVEATDTSDGNGGGSEDDDRPDQVKNNNLRKQLRAQTGVTVVSRDPVTGKMKLSDGTEFDPDYYAKKNPDVVKSWGSDPDDLLNHYLIFGRSEDRPSSLADQVAKEEAYREFASALEQEDEVELPPANSDYTESGPGPGSNKSTGGGTTNGGGNNGGGTTAASTGTLGANSEVTVGGTVVGKVTSTGFDPAANCNIDLPMDIKDGANVVQTVQDLRDIEWAAPGGTGGYYSNIKDTKKNVTIYRSSATQFTITYGDGTTKTATNASISAEIAALY